MHISEGVLSAPVLGAGIMLSIVGTSIGLKKTDYEHIPPVALLACVFFVASLIHVPVGPSSVHLLLNGLLGLLLGWAVFPAILIALLLQMVFFGFGGISSLGVNTFIMAAPAVIVYYLFRSALVRASKSRGILFCGFGAGICAIFLSAVCAAAALYCSGSKFFVVSKIIIISHLPIGVIEGLITGFIVMFIKKVRPEMVMLIK